MKYFFDSYAIIELAARNINYKQYEREPLTITQFNMAEIYYSALRTSGERTAEALYNICAAAVVSVKEDILKEAMKFKLKHKKRRLSYTDCIGYVYAQKNNMKFLTGDKEFKDLPNVEFVQ